MAPSTITTVESSVHLEIGTLAAIIMPTYYSRLTTVQLAVADLQDTTTTKPESRFTSAAFDQISICAAKFARASITGTLDETPILTEDAKQTHVRFLGKFSDMPFFIVRAGQSFFDLGIEGGRTRRPARVPPPTVNDNGQHILYISYLFLLMR